MDAIALHQYGIDCAVASLGTALTEEHAQLLAKYTNQVVLTYDGDEAGQNATRRAIPMLEKAGLQVKILRMQGAKDPDEFLKKFGRDKFLVLLDKSENQAEYRLLSLQNRFDLNQDDQRVAFLKEAANLVSTFSTAVEREVYGARAAEAAGITAEAMKVEVERAFRRRKAQEKKKQEQADLNVQAQIQPKEKGLYYTNTRSARAEEQILVQVLKEPGCLDKLGLMHQQFSSSVLGKAFALLQQQHQEGRPVGLAGLEGEFTREEMSHLTSVVGRYDTLVSEQVLSDCVAVIREEYQKSLQKGEDAIQNWQNRFRNKQRYGG